VVRDRHPDINRRRFMLFCRSADRSGDTESDIKNFSCVCVLPTNSGEVQKFEEVAASIVDPQNRDHATSVLRAMRSGAPVVGHADVLAEQRSLENRVVRVRCEGSGDNAYVHVLQVLGRTAHAIWLLTRGDVLRYRNHPGTSKRVRSRIDAVDLSESELLYADWPDMIPLASLREPVPLRLVPVSGPARPLAGLFCRFMCRCTAAPSEPELPENRGRAAPAPAPGGPAAYAIDFDPRWALLPVAGAAAPPVRAATLAARTGLVAAYDWRVAVAMARHRRLGGGSLLGRLDDRLLADIADAAGAGAGWAM
jgi:hypothetical protein